MSSHGTRPAPRASEPPDLRRRLALRPREAAAALGISEKKLRELLPELPHRRCAGVLLFSVTGLRAWLDGERPAPSPEDPEPGAEDLRQQQPEGEPVAPRGGEVEDAIAREELAKFTR